MACNAVGAQRAPGRLYTADAEAAEIASKPSAFVRENFVVNAVDESIKRSTDKAIARSVNCQFLKAASNHPPAQKVVRVGIENVDSASHTAQNGRGLLVATAQVAAQTSLNGKAKQARDQ